MLELAAGRRVLIEGKRPEGVYLLVRGGVRVRLSGGTKGEIIARLFAAPAMFGECDVLCDTPWAQTVDVAIAAKLVLIPRHTFIELLAANPTLTTDLLRDVAKRLMLTSELCRQLAFGDVRTRVARRVLDYVDVFGVERDGDVVIEAALSQRALASELAVSRRAAQEAVSSLIRANILRKDGSHLVVANLKKLRALAEPFAQSIGHTLETVAT